MDTAIQTGRILDFARVVFVRLVDLRLLFDHGVGLPSRCSHFLPLFANKLVKLLVLRQGGDKPGQDMTYKECWPITQSSKSIWCSLTDTTPIQTGRILNLARVVSARLVEFRLMFDHGVELPSRCSHFIPLLANKVKLGYVLASPSCGCSSSCSDFSLQWFSADADLLIFPLLSLLKPKKSYCTVVRP